LRMKRIVSCISGFPPAKNYLCMREREFSRFQETVLLNATGMIPNLLSQKLAQPEGDVKKEA
jgi:hypothetical protein